MASPLTPNSGQSNLESLYADILRLPPQEQQQALAKLSANYPGQIDDLKREQDFYADEAATAMPKGTIAGPSSNPYTHYVAASPLEHAASALRKYGGAKRFREASAARDAIRAKQADIDLMARKAALKAQMADPETALDLWEADQRRGYRGITGG